MLIKEQPTDRLIPYVNNARTHSEEQVSQIAASIREFGFNNPVLVDSENNIIAGHGRLLAARKLDLDTIPTVCLDHLSESQKKAYILADNKLALNAGWDDELLQIEIQGIDDLIKYTGFSDQELQDIFPTFEPATEEDQGKLDELDPVWVSCPHCGKEFNARES
jgi:ParB-like chromosome segregation protein Spo0J